MAGLPQPQAQWIGDDSFKCVCYQADFAGKSFDIIVSLQVNQNYPDFKSKDGSHALWLNKAPQPVLSELEGMKFDVQIQKSKQAKESKGEPAQVCHKLRCTILSNLYSAIILCHCLRQ